MKLFVLVFLWCLSFNVYSKAVHVSPTGTGLISEGLNWTTSVNTDTLLAIIASAGIASGDTVVFLGGNYSLSVNIDMSAIKGSRNSPVLIIGVKPTTTNYGSNISTADLAMVTTDMPAINMGTSYFRVGDTSRVQNLRVYSSSSTASYGVLAGGNRCIIAGCVVANNYATDANVAAITSGGNSLIVNNKITSLNKGADASTGSFIVCNKFYGASTNTNGSGVRIGANSIGIIANKFYMCNRGIYAPAANDGILRFKNVFYGCGRADTTGSAYNCWWINNLIDSSTISGISSGASYKHFYLDGNWGGNDRNVNMFNNIPETGILSDYNIGSGNPNFVSGFDDDLRLKQTTPCTTGVAP